MLWLCNLQIKQISGSEILTKQLEKKLVNYFSSSLCYLIHKEKHLFYLYLTVEILVTSFSCGLNIDCLF